MNTKNFTKPSTKNSLNGYIIGGAIILICVVLYAVSHGGHDQPSRLPPQASAPAKINAEPFTDQALFVAAWREPVLKPELLAREIATVQAHPDWFSSIIGQKDYFMLENSDVISGKYDVLLPYIDMSSPAAVDLFIWVVDANQIKSAEAMLELKMDPNRKGKILNQTAIFSARSKDMVELLAKYGANMNPIDSQGLTPYQSRKKYARFDILEAMKAHGAQ